MTKHISSFSKSVAVLLLGVFVLSGMFSNEMMMIWISMEFSTLMFLMILGLAPPLAKKTEVLKLFLVQSFTSIGFIAMYLFSCKFSAEKLDFLMSGLLMVKMGVIPFHGWVMSALETFSWELIFYLMTLLKFLPLAVLESVSGPSVIWFAILNWAGGALMSGKVQNFKALFVFSSMFFMGMILSSVFLFKFMWVSYMMVYTLLVFPLLIFMTEANSGSKFSLGFSNLKLSLKVLFFLSMLNISGVPPFPGFFLKLDFILNFLSVSFWLTLFFLGGSVYLVYMYMSSVLWLTSDSTSGLSAHLSFPQFFLVVMLTSPGVLMLFM